MNDTMKPVGNETWKWEGHVENEAGQATFHFMGGSVVVYLPSFRVAFTLAEAIERERANVRRTERRRAFNAVRGFMDQEVVR